MDKNHYILFVDDSGSRFPDHRIVEGKEFDCFALGGVLINKKDIPNIIFQHKEFCREWNVTVPLHSYEIRNATKGFSWIGKTDEIKYRFWRAVGDFLIDLPVVAFATVVDRSGYNIKFKDKYQNARWMMCKTTFAILVERVAKYVIAQNATFEIFFEGSTKRENNLLVNYGKSYKKEGLPFSADTSAQYTPLQTEDFRQVLIGNPKRGFKTNPLLQIADMYLFPMVARKYHGVDYLPWRSMYETKRVIDALIPEESWQQCGIKYSCFEYKK